MMNSTATMNPSAFHKMVVGIGLAVVFGVGVSVFAVSARHDNLIARNAPSALDQSATDATAPVPSAPTEMPFDPTATVPNAAPAVPPVVAPAPTAPTASNITKGAAGKPPGDESRPTTSKASDRAERGVARTHNSGDTADIRVASAAYSNKSSANESSLNSSDSVKSGNELALAPSLSDMPSLAPASDEPATSDSQITAYVKSEIAAAAPNSSVDVTTTNGVVALAGSVPSQDAVEKARQAARGVAGVKYVDVSALTVSNQ